MNPGAARAAVAALTLLALWPVLLNGLPTYDDRLAIVENAARWSLFSIDKGAWQPLGWLALALIHAAAGLRPWAYHAASLGVHLVCGMLVFDLARRLYPASKAALAAAAAAALLFCVHPLQVHIVAQAAALGDLLSVLFGLAAVRLHVSGGRRPLVLACFAASALCHWHAVVLPFILLVLDAAVLKRRPAPREKLPLFAVAAALVVLTLAVKARYGSGLSHTLRPANLAYSLRWFLEKSFAPFDIPSIEFLHGPFSARTWSLAGCAALAVAATAVAATRRHALAAWACWALLLAPTSMLSVDGGFYVVARYGYFAHAAFSILAGAAVLRAPAAALAPLALIPLASAQARVWRDPLSILAHDLAVNPEHGAFFLRTGRDRADLGARLLEAGYPAQAEFQLRRALALDPKLADAHNNLGALLAQSGRGAEAAERFESAVRLAPAMPGARENLSRARRAKARSGRP